MSPAQLKLYRREWGAARKAGQLKESDRHRLHLETFGVDKSSLDLTNAELDQILATFRAISQPYNLNAQVRQIEQPRTRLLKHIQDQLTCLGLFVEHPCNYLAAILHDRFNGAQLEDLRTVLTSPRPAGDHDSQSEQLLEGNKLVAGLGTHWDRVRGSDADQHQGIDIPRDDLIHVRNTLARCLSSFRQKADLTEHEMCSRAGVECFRPACAECRESLILNRSSRREEALETNPF